MDEVTKKTLGKIYQELIDQRGVGLGLDDVIEGFSKSFDENSDFPRCVFFSPQTHRDLNGEGSFEFRNAKGRMVFANYDGWMIDGFPGFVRDGVVLRPPRYETYRFVGEVAGPSRSSVTTRKPQTSFDPSVR